MMPAGVHGTNRGRPWWRSPTFSGWNPSTSLRGCDRVEDTGRIVAGRKWKLDEDPVDFRIPICARDLGEQRVRRDVGRQRSASPRIPVSPAAFVFEDT